MIKDKKITRNPENVHKTRGSSKPEVMMPVPASQMEMPEGYAEFFLGLKERIARERIKAVLSANSAMVLMYWDMGRAILERQKEEGWGAKVIDRLSHDLRKAFPDMTGFSARNLKYMRKFAESWPKRSIVQEVLAQITWYHNLALLEKTSDSNPVMSASSTFISMWWIICCGIQMTSHRLVYCWSRTRTRWWWNTRWPDTASLSVLPSGKGKSHNPCRMN